MPTKREQRVEVNNFSNGFITEASQLVFPQNSLSDIDNFIIRRDGSVARRLGMGKELSGFAVNTGVNKTTLVYDTISSYNWKEVAGDNNREFIVIQVGKKLLFFDAYSDVTSLGLVGSVELSSSPDNVRFSFTSTEGILIVATGSIDVSTVEYDSATNLFSTSNIRILTRDVWGIQDTDPAYNESDTYTGTPVDAKRRYNLQNQSWGIPRRDVSDGVGESFPIRDPIGGLVDRPSNCQTIWLGMTNRPSRTYGDGTGGVPYEGFSNTVFQSNEGKYPTAAKGYFIIDALDRGAGRRKAVSNNLRDYPILASYSTSSFPIDRTTGGPTVVAEFAGRVFYSGFSGVVVSGDNRSPNYSNFIFFSQVAKNKKDLNKCYQEGDPTSRDAPDVVDTDGGFLRISEAIDIISMFPLGGGLLVLASNGVWMIKGGSDYGFSASNYKVDKLSEFGILAPKSVVREGSSAYFWASDAIYIIAKDQFGDYKVNSITLAKIQKHYDSIPTEVKFNAVGVYNQSNKTVRWTYSDEDETTKELVLDVLQGCFYKNTIYSTAGGDIKIYGPFQLPPFTSFQELDDVYVEEDQVFSSTNSVFVSTTLFDSSNDYVRYLYIDNSFGPEIYIGFCDYINTDFLDFGNEDASALLITGTSIAGDSGIDKQIPYITSHFEVTETVADLDGKLYPASGCLMRGQWSFANSVQSHKWSPAQQIYRLNKPYPEIIPGNVWDRGFDITTTKSKVRGKGPAFALRIETQPGKDCRLVGWNVTINGNAIS